jgi:menaquinone-dependent protoporphyrinogen oxidase
MSSTVLIVYQSTEGHTATVAHHIARVMAERGFGVTVERAAEAPPPAGFDCVVLGDSIHLGRHSRQLVSYADAYRIQLAEVPVALFQVSLTSAGTDDEDVTKAEKMLEEFRAETGLEPDQVGLFAGALAYTRYRGLKRWLMRRIAADAGLDQDTDVDHVYTDWASVDAFAESVARMVRRDGTEDPRAVIAPLVDLDVPTVDPTATLEQVVEQLVAHDSGVVLVTSVDADPLCTESMGGAVGVVSERDVIEAIRDGADLSLVWAADIMTTRLISMPASRTVEELAGVMIDNHIRHVVVPSSGGRPGVVSMRSLVGRIAADRTDQRGADAPEAGP